MSATPPSEPSFAAPPPAGQAPDSPFDTDVYAAPRAQVAGEEQPFGKLRRAAVLLNFITFLVAIPVVLFGLVMLVMGGKNLLSGYGDRGTMLFALLCLTPPAIFVFNMYSIRRWRERARLRSAVVWVDSVAGGLWLAGTAIVFVMQDSGFLPLVMLALGLPYGMALAAAMRDKPEAGAVGE